MAICCAAFAANRNTVAAEQSPYAAYYNPTSGFKPAQRDFTKIFMQLAGSLEHHGSPEPYIRHMMAEHDRIERKYKAATGKEASVRPKYLTAQFVENLITTWNKITPGLKLDTLSKDAGRNMRLAIMGTWNLSAQELVAHEGKLSTEEAAAYRKLLDKSFFAKGDMKLLDAFYKGSYDKLSDLGKSNLSRRIHLGSMPAGERDAEIQNQKGGSLSVKLLNKHTDDLMHYMTTDSQKEVNGDTLLSSLKTGLKLGGPVPNLNGIDEYERDAYQFSHAIKWEFDQRFNYIRKAVAPAKDAEDTIEAVYAMVDNLSVILNSEFEAALLEMRTVK